MPNNVRTVVHRHQHYNSGGGGAVVGSVLKFGFEVALVALQFVVWAVPVIVQGLIWMGRNVAGPCLRMFGQFVIRQAAKVSAAHARRGQCRPGQGGGW